MVWCGLIPSRLSTLVSKPVRVRSRCLDGWLVKGGERRSIEAATVAGDIRQVLKSLLAFEGEARSPLMGCALTSGLRVW